MIYLIHAHQLDLLCVFRHASPLLTVTLLLPVYLPTCLCSGKKTRVCFLEWVDPLYCGGHWVPQMLDWAGGQDVNCNDGADSTRMAWEKVLAWQPEVRGWRAVGGSSRLRDV